MQIKALLVTSDFPPTFGGGIARYYHSMCMHTKHQMVVLAPHDRNTASFDSAQPFPVNRLRVPLQRFFVLRLLQALILVWRGSLIAKNTNSKVVILGHWYFAFFGFVLRFYSRLPFIVVLHGGELDRFRSYSLLLRLAIVCIEQASAVIVNSDYTAQQYRNHGGRHARIVKIAPGVDTLYFSPSMKCDHVIRRHHLQGKRVLLTVSRLVERKGHDIVIRALPIILQNIPQCVYLIVGSGPEERRLRDLAQTLNVSDHVIFAGSVADAELPAYYNACDIFTMPSRALDKREGIEGFGIVYLEANACGKAVIGGRSGGVSEAVEEGVSGILVDPNNESELAKAAIRLLNDPLQMSRLGMQGRRRVEYNYDVRIQASRLDQLIKTVLEDVPN